MHQVVWIATGPSQWVVAGKVPMFAPVDRILAKVPRGTPFSISIGGLVIFRGVLS